MSKETIITKLNGKKEKERIIREQAKHCLNDLVELENPQKDLANQLFEDAPTILKSNRKNVYIKLNSIKRSFCHCIRKWRFCN